MDELLKLIIPGIPNFVGFALFSLAMYKIFNRAMDILQVVIEDCIRDRSSDKTTKG